MKTLLRTGLLILVSAVLIQIPARAQAPAGQAPAAQTGQNANPKDQVIVPTSGANIHMSAGSGAELLVTVPKGTVLTVLARDKEWLQVQLTPELRKTGRVYRWYKNEDKGWMHDSTVQLVK